MIKDLLQGRPLEHPLHPALVHLPIALFIFSLLLDLGTLLVEPSNALVRAAYYTMLGGVVTALVAAIPGFADYLSIRSDHPSRTFATMHMVLNLALIAIYIANSFMRAEEMQATVVPTLPFVLSLAGAGILGISGYLGGYMVYQDGIGVGRHRRETDLPDSTINTPRAKDGEFVPVADADSLNERETLRVNFNHQVVTIALVDGELYAFQEFCSHRFGPLSEGSFHDGQVQCPWHRSCFDMRTGEVTQGPAKVDLHTYEVTVREGKIMVRGPQKEPV